MLCWQFCEFVTFLGWWVYLTRTQRFFKVTNQLSGLFVGSTAWIYSTCITWVLGIHFFDWFLFLQTHSFSMRLFARGGQSQSKSQGALLGGRPESVRATITSWRGTFEIYYLWIIWHIFSLIQFWIATFIYQYSNAKEWRNLTHFHGCGPVKIHPVWNWTPKNWSLVPGNSANVTDLGGEFCK